MFQRWGLARTALSRSAVSKLKENMLAGNDVKLLSSEENAFLTTSSCLARSLIISPSRLDRQLVGKAADDNSPLREVINRNVIVMRRMRDRPVTSRATYQFLVEIIEQKRPYQETSLYKLFIAGEPLRRYVQTADSVQKIWMNSTEDFASYYEKCMRLASSIRQRGMVDINRKIPYLALPREIRKKDTNIGLAIDKTGKPMLYKTGQHRLALAQILGLEEIPVRIRVISGEFLKEFVKDVEGLDEKALFGGINAATDYVCAEREPGPKLSPA